MSTTTKLMRVLRGDRRIEEITSVSNGYASGDTPHVYRGNGVTMQFGIFLSADVVDSLSDMASVTVQYQDGRDASETIADKTISAVDITSVITGAGFLDGSEAHFTVEFSNAEMNPDLGAEDSKSFWLVVFGTDSEGKERTFAAGNYLTIEEDGSGASPGEPPEGQTAINAETAAGLIDTKIGIKHRGSIAGGSTTGEVSWGETLDAAPDATDVYVAGVQPTDLAEKAGATRISAITTTGCTVTTVSGSHASALTVWVERWITD